MKTKLLTLLSIAFAVSLMAEVVLPPQVVTGVVVRSNRTKTLTVNAPATVSPTEWTIEFQRQVVTTTDGVVTEEEASDPINIKLGQILGRTFTRADGSTFTGAQLLGDIKFLGDKLYTERNPQP